MYCFFESLFTEGTNSIRTIGWKSTSSVKFFRAGDRTHCASLPSVRNKPWPLVVTKFIWGMLEFLLMIGSGRKVSFSLTQKVIRKLVGFYFSEQSWDALRQGPGVSSTCWTCQSLSTGPLHCSGNTLNGDLASATIPEESRLMAKTQSESEEPLPPFSWGNGHVQLPLSVAMQKLL